MSPHAIGIPVRWDDPSVPSGLVVVPDWIDEETEILLTAEIDANEWISKIKRRVQHYGFVFEYSSLNVRDAEPTPFPAACKSLLRRLEIHQFDQLTINEYLPGVGIASHCDTHSAFSSVIASVSLLAAITMDFVPHEKGITGSDSFCNSRRISVVIPRRSLVLLTGESRYGWRHSIASRKTDRGAITGEIRERKRRISLTFRKCVSSACKCEFPSLCDSQGADLSRPRRIENG